MMIKREMTKPKTLLESSKTLLVLSKKYRVYICRMLNFDNFNVKIGHFLLL